MSRVEEIEKSVQALSPEELASFRDWFSRFDDEVWDEKIERDALSGKLDALAGAALASHRSGESREL